MLVGAPALPVTVPLAHSVLPVTVLQSASALGEAATAAAVTVITRAGTAQSKATFTTNPFRAVRSEANHENEQQRHRGVNGILILDGGKPVWMVATDIERRTPDLERYTASDERRNWLAHSAIRSLSAISRSSCPAGIVYANRRSSVANERKSSRITLSSMGISPPKKQ
jgi:hypothetical protein